MRNIKKLVVPSLILTAVGGFLYYAGWRMVHDSNQRRTPEFVRDGEFEGYEVTIGVDGLKRGICINDSNSNAHLSASDYKFNGLGRFDEIHLETVPQGHPLEDLANLTDLERVYKSVKSERK